MLNTKKILNSLDEYISSVKYKSNSSELKQLEEIRNSIINAASEEDQIKWYFELVKYIMLIKEFLDHS